MKQKFCEKCLHLWGAYEDTCHCTGPCHNIEPCRQAFEERAEERQAQAEEVLAALSHPCRLVWGRLDVSIGGTTLTCEVHNWRRAGWVGNKSDLYGGEGYYVCEETKQALSGKVNQL